MANVESVDGYTPQATGGLLSGMIVVWHGTLANIPAGFVICDGNNGSPNLLDRFLQGVATAATDPGTTGGATSQSVSSHRHNSPNHQHTGGTSNANSGSGSSGHPGTTSMSQHTHTHSNCRTYTDGATYGGYNTTTVSDGRPKYYEIAFIMKT